MKKRSILITLFTACYLIACSTTPTDTTNKKTVTTRPSVASIEETQIKSTHSNPQQITTPAEPAKNIKVEHASLFDKINFSCIRYLCCCYLCPFNHK